VFAGLWTSVCIVDPVLSALEQGYEAYVITDACGDMSDEVHERAVQRMIQAGARPMTSVQYLLELQRDWARAETYELTTGIAKTYGGAYGLGIIYAHSMLARTPADVSTGRRPGSGRLPPLDGTEMLMKPYLCRSPSACWSASSMRCSTSARRHPRSSRWSACSASCSASRSPR
jgi:hypothetical protein